jgi:hypothetical protein
MTGMPSSKQQRIAQELARLAVLDRAGCLDLWKTLFDCEAPRYLSAVFMRKALAHEAQCRMLGGLAAADICALRSIAGGKRSAVRSAPVLSAGTHLVREWNGRTYQVEVTKSGFVMDGKTYKSLTAIARRITGANWSGPRFFGLVDRSNREKEGDKAGPSPDQGNEQAGDQTGSPTSVDSVPPEVGLTDSYDSGFSGSPLSGLTGSRPADAESPRP